MNHHNKRQSPKHYKRIVAIRIENYNRTFRKRFWARVVKTSKCWNWEGSKNEQGYGTLSMYGKLTKAHRVSYRLKHGDIPKGKWVLHHCDNSSCVRPSHLYLGDHSDNTRDAIARKRYARGEGHYFKDRLKGEENPHAMITEQLVLEIRSKHRPLIYGYRKMAKDYGLTRSHIRQIVRRITWAHI